jgi:hypothetical protein
VTTKPQELAPEDAERVHQLILECNAFPSEVAPEVKLAAYSAVLLKDIRWNLGELLAYKQMEIHR